MLFTKMNEIIDEVSAEVAEREELIECIALALLSKKNLFILGDTGQAKSYAINEFRKRITGAKQFERLMSKQTDEEQIFGRLDLSSLIPGNMPHEELMKEQPYADFSVELAKLYDKYKTDKQMSTLKEAAEAAKKMEYIKSIICALKNGTPKIVTDGKIPDSHIVFLDELFKSNDGILNSLLTALNERVYTNEGQTVKIPVISFFSASNEIPNFNDSNVGASTWSADGIQWNFDPKRIDGYGVKNHHEFGLALRNDGAVDHYRWLAIAGRQGGAFNDDFNVAKKKAEAVITRYEETKTTLYEAAYPWNELLPEGDKAQHGSLYGFSIILNDDDGSGREGWISYIDRDIIGRSKSADRFADLLLIDSRGKEEVSFPEKYNWVKADFNLLKKDGIITEDASEELLGGNVTVEEFLNKLYLVTGEEITMSDVNKALVRMGMMNTMNNVFISRGRYQNSDEYALLDAFEDCKNLSDADKQTVVNLVAQGLIQGSNGYIRSEEFTTYAEMVAVLSRIKNNL